MRYDTPAYITAWPGYVVLPDALNYPQLIVWQDSIEAMAELGEGLTWSAAAANPRTAQHLVNAYCALVVEWHLDKLPPNLTLETFPATPRTQAALLIAWLGGLVSNLLEGSEDTPEKKAE